MSRKETLAKAKLSTRRLFLTPEVLRTLSYIATLILVGYLAKSGIDSPATYAFLGVLIGSMFGRPAGNAK